MRSALRVGDRVTTRPSFAVGTIRYIEDGAACVKWDTLSMIYTYELSRLTLASVRQPREIIPAWAVKLQGGVR
jgi:hypothetical protein